MEALAEKAMADMELDDGTYPEMVEGHETLRMFSSAGQLRSGVKQENASYNMDDVKFEAGTGECGELVKHLCKGCCGKPKEPPPNTICSHCNYELKYKNSLAKHLSTGSCVIRKKSLYNPSADIDVDQLDMTTCWVCKESFQNHSKLQKHIIIEHFPDELEAKIREEINSRKRSICPYTATKASDKFTF